MPERLTDARIDELLDTYLHAPSIRSLLEEVRERRAADAELLEACKSAKKFLEPDLVEPGRTVFWKLVAAIARAEKEGRNR